MILLILNILKQSFTRSSQRQLFEVCVVRGSQTVFTDVSLRFKLISVEKGLNLFVPQHHFRFLRILIDRVL